MKNCDTSGLQELTESDAGVDSGIVVNEENIVRMQGLIMSTEIMKHLLQKFDVGIAVDGFSPFHMVHMHLARESHGCQNHRLRGELGASVDNWLVIVGVYPSCVDVLVIHRVVVHDLLINDNSFCH